MSRSLYRKVVFALKKKLFEVSDLLSTIDAREVYNSAIAVCINKDPAFLKREVFWG